MPHYEYACKDCGEHLEVVQSFKDDALTACPACRGRLRKVFSPIGIQFRGAGFYRTDHRPRIKESSSDAKTADGAAKSDGSSAPAAKTESAPAASSPSEKSSAAAS